VTIYRPEEHRPKQDLGPLRWMVIAIFVLAALIALVLVATIVKVRG